MNHSKDKKSSFFEDDHSLFLRLKKYKDKQAFLLAYDQYAEAIYRFIFFRIGHEEDARDLTSAVFLKCWSAVQEGRLNDDNDYKSLRSFLYKIARNQTIDYYRQSKPNTDLAEAETVIDDKQDLGVIDQGLGLDLIQQQLLNLKEEYRTILVMRYINDLSISEISDITGKDKGNVRVTILRAIKALKNLIKPHEGQGTTSTT
jgi:RNA polymerase sigma-70 factor (ECF subfamily)